jgi:hypothetical protein
MTTALQRQFITDTHGTPLGIILPWEEYHWLEETLKQRYPSANNEEKLKLMEQAPQDARFMADLHAVMSDFATLDAEYKEPTQ